MKHRKLLCTLGALLLVGATIVSCGGDQGDDPKVEPTDPEEPTDPTDPTDPEDPTDPSDPDPVEPVDPEDPTDPSDPTTEPIDFDFEWLLGQLQSTEFAQAGTLEIYGGDETGASGEVTIGIKSVWDGEFFFLEHTYYEDDGSTSTADTRVYRGDNGLAVSRYLNYDNTFLDYPWTYDSGENVYFDDEYDNPFKNVTTDDFEAVEVDEDGTTTIVLTIQEEYSLYFSFFLAGYEDIPLDVITFTVDEDLTTISGSVSFYEEYEEDGVDKYSGGAYQFELVSQDTIETNKVTQFEITEGHAPLSSLLTTLSNHNFTMKVNRNSTSYNTSYETIEMSNVSLRTYDVDESDISNREYIGYYENDDGLHSVTSNGSSLLADDYPITSYGLSTLRSNMGLSAALFDVKDENTFVLKEGYESYAIYGAVDYRYNFDFLYYLDAGSYTIKILDESVEISYSYSYYDYGNLVTGTVKLVLTNIGTTNIDAFTFVAYEAPTGRDSYGSSTTEILTKYLDNKYNNILPFIDFSNYNSGGVSEMSTPSARVYFQDNNNGGDTFVTEYRKSLEEIGWTLVENRDDYTYIYPRDEGDGYYHLRIYSLSSGRYVYMFIYEKGGSLADYLKGKYESTINSTVTIEQANTYYYYDSSTSTKGDVYSTTNITTKYQFLDNQVLKTQTRNSSTSTTYFAAYDDGSFYVYSLTSSGEWSTTTYYDSSYNCTVPTYLNYGTYPPTALLDYTSNFTYQSGTDAVYVPLSDYVSLIAQCIFDVSNNSTFSLAQLEIDYFNNQFIISLTAERISGSYLIEDVFTATYSNFGSTTISNITLPEQPSS